MTSAWDAENDPVTGISNVGKGWEPLIRELEVKLNALGDFKIDQVKEKFGSLRYYATIDTEDKETYQAFRTAIEEAEEKSEHLCEECGEPAEIKEYNGWMKAYCDQHRDERLARIEQWRRELKERTT